MQVTRLSESNTHFERSMLVLATSKGLSLGVMESFGESRRSRAYQATPQTDSKQLSEAFFSGNIGSLLDVAAQLSRVEITRRASANGMHEEIHFVLTSSE